MTGKKFAKILKLLFPEAWQKSSAKALGLNVATIRRMVAKEYVSKRDEFAIRWLMHVNAQKEKE